MRRLLLRVKSGLVRRYAMGIGHAVWRVDLIGKLGADGHARIIGQLKISGAVRRIRRGDVCRCVGGAQQGSMADLCARLKARGYTLALASSKPEAMAEQVLERFHLAQYFHKICGATLDTTRSTKEAVIAYLLEENGQAENMVMVGDTKFDVLGAKAHGIPTIGVTWGYGTLEELVEAGAAAIAHSPEELLELLNC